MIKINKRAMGLMIAGIITFTSLSALLSIDSISVVYAAESKALRDAKAKISHLTKSLKTNYLGIKNQGTWELYIKQARELIKKIPNSEKSQRNALTVEVNKDEALVKGLARINHVEKSMAINSKTMRNVDVWNEYLILAEIDLEKVDKSIFKKQYDELIDRMDKVSLIIKDIEDKFDIEYNKVFKLYEEAKSTGDLNKAEEALKEVKKLSECEKSTKLEKYIEVLLGIGVEEINKVIGDLDSFYKSLPSSEVQYFENVINRVNVDLIKVGNGYVTLFPYKELERDYISIGYDKAKGRYMIEQSYDRAYQHIETFLDLRFAIGDSIFPKRAYWDAGIKSDQWKNDFITKNKDTMLYAKEGTVWQNDFFINKFRVNTYIKKNKYNYSTVTCIYEK